MSETIFLTLKSIGFQSWHMQRVGKVGRCSRCGQEKVIMAGFTSESNPSGDSAFCKECYNEMHSCACEICDKEVSIHRYAEHLKGSHTIEDMASLISQRMIDYKQGRMTEF